MKNTIATSLVRLAALPVSSAGILAGAALGLAGTAGAQAQAPNGPGHSFAPQTHAAPAATQAPGWQAHHGPARVANLEHR